MVIFHTPEPSEPWKKGKLVGQKAPLKLKDIWATRIRCSIIARADVFPLPQDRSIEITNPAVDETRSSALVAAAAKQLR